MTRDRSEPDRPRWLRHFVCQRQSLRTTWKLRLAALFIVAILIGYNCESLTVGIGQSLVCIEQTFPADALLLENFDPYYLVFERAAELRDAGIATRFLIPTQVSGDSDSPNAVSAGTVELMARIARLPEIEIVPYRQVEPISLNAARQLKDFLTQEGLKSVVVVSPGFRSQRSALVYAALLTPAGIRVGCAPVIGERTIANWTDESHGIQEVFLEFIKLQYYRFYVLRPASAQ